MLTVRYIARTVPQRVSLLRKCKYHKMELKEIVTKLNEFAPLELAEKWDNVGLLVEPSGKHTVDSILLTNDLTEPVLHEAIDAKANMIISYHPPIFVPLKRLTSKTFKERIVVKAIENRIAVYSPHTCFDAVQNGVNDWLAAGLGSAKVEPLEYCKEENPVNCEYKLVTKVLDSSASSAAHIQETLNALDGVEHVETEKLIRPDGPFEHKISIMCSERGLMKTLQLLKCEIPEATKRTEVFQLAQVPILGTGPGRLCELHSSTSLSELIDRIKKHLSLKHVRVAIGYTGGSYQGDPLQRSVHSVALCAGAGASVLRGRKADVFLTGEMSHHDVLDAVSRGIHVILCEHSNTERGFLHHFKTTLNLLLEKKVDIRVSSCDRDPLQVI